MPVIDTDNSAYNEDSDTSWNAQLQNSKILLFEYDKAILALSQTGGVLSYKLDSGQSAQSVTRQDLPRLIETRALLLSQIQDLEIFLGVRPSVKQCVPAW